MPIFPLPTPTYRNPALAVIEIYYETEWYQPSAETMPALKNQASRYSDRGVSLRRLDHIALFASDVHSNRHFMQETLGARMTALKRQPGSHSQTKPMM